MTGDSRLLQDVLAEEAVIAALLLDDREVVAEGVLGILSADMFVDGPCRAAYRAFLYLREQGVEVTYITVRRAWIDLGWIDDVDRATGGIGAEPWLADVVGKHLTTHGASAHARTVRDLHNRRQAIGRAQETAQAALSAPVSQSLHMPGLRKFAS